jgi:hypothetical protein
LDASLANWTPRVNDPVSVPHMSVLNQATGLLPGSPSLDQNSIAGTFPALGPYLE